MDTVALVSYTRMEMLDIMMTIEEEGKTMWMVEEGGLVEMTMITVETGTDIILCRPVLTRPSRSRHHAARAWPRHSHYTWKRTFSQSRRRPLLVVETFY